MIKIKDVSGDVEVVNRKNQQKRKVHGNCILEVDKQFNISINTIGNSRAVVLVMDDKSFGKKKTFTLGPNSGICITNEKSDTNQVLSNAKWLIGKVWAYIGPEWDPEDFNVAVGVRG